MAEERLRGRPASPGFAAGRVVVLATGDGERRTSSGDPMIEAGALHDAVATALMETAALVAQSDGETADMIAFQAAMLEDAELVRPATAAIADGTPADVAWQAAMDTEIADYAAADDPYFRARSADLRDIRDRVLAKLRPDGGHSTTTLGAVIAANDLTLSRFLAIDWDQGGAILLTEGSPSSHVAMLARARGVPMVVDLGGTPDLLEGREVIVDAVAGEIVLEPDAVTRDLFVTKAGTAARSAAKAAAHVVRETYTADGTRIAVHLNIVGAAEVARLDPAICDGIGLFRTEFLFLNRQLPDEDAQYAAYRDAVTWANGRPVTIRTLDAGGDKPIAGVTVDGESNPFLGQRGIRLSLRHPELFRVQLRALLRAARHGTLRIMLPMVTVPDELAAARALLDAEIAAFARDGAPVPAPELGIMVEVPAAAIAIDRFDAAFFSIGSNDLTQYVTAAGRDIGSVAALADPLNPAVLRLIKSVVQYGREHGRDVSLCGDAGGDPAMVPALLATGLRSLSVSPAALAEAKRAVAGVDLRAMRK